MELEWGREEPGAKVWKSGKNLGRGIEGSLLEWRDAERDDGSGAWE